MTTVDSAGGARDAWVEPHLTVLGALYIACGALAVVAGAVVWMILTVVGLNVDDPIARGIVPGIGLTIALLLLAVGVPCVVEGIGLLQRRVWARLLGLVLGSLSLINFPFGTLLGVYTLVILVQEAAVRRLQSTGPPWPSSDRPVPSAR